jgi:hypothetical protein
MLKEIFENRDIYKYLILVVGVITFALVAYFNSKAIDNLKWEYKDKEPIAFLGFGIKKWYSEIGLSYNRKAFYTLLIGITVFLLIGFLLVM